VDYVVVYSKFYTLSISAKCENLLRIDKAAESFKVGTFLRHSVVRLFRGWQAATITNTT